LAALAMAMITTTKIASATFTFPEEHGNTDEKSRRKTEKEVLDRLLPIKGRRATLKSSDVSSPIYLSLFKLDRKKEEENVVEIPDKEGLALETS
jgi:hypothetical protein